MPAYEMEKTQPILHSTAVGAGTSTITPSNGVNCAGADACRFIVAWGAITTAGVQSIEVHQSSDDGSSDAYTAIAGTNIAVADDDDNTLTVIDIINPGEQYLKCIVNRATQNSAVNAIIALVGSPGTSPSSLTGEATVNGYEIHNFAAEGSA